ncbi:MAG: DNRLRE domain-containing protein [Caldilineales bacterium]|nr:DNRLRE domain-containing protein [Caldilineales bacterium]
MAFSLIPLNGVAAAPLQATGVDSVASHSAIDRVSPPIISADQPQMELDAMALAPAAIPANLPFVYFAPFPENQVKQTFDTIQSNGSDYVSVVYIIAAEDNTVIVYDHWEDGYEPNIAQPVQATTRVFGDGDTANGDANNYCVNSNCPGDIVGRGDVLILEPFQQISIPRNPSLIKFDGRDKFASNQRVGNGRSFWPLDAGPLFAGAEQFLSADEFGTTFVMPIGQDLSALSTEAFERVAAYIMPSQNQTNCTWNGTPLNPLNQGDGIRRASVQTGDTLVCNKPVQLHLITGDVGSNYESRTFAIFGRESWSSSYYDPVASVPGAYDDAVNYIYNPQGSTLQVRAETRFGTTNINVPAGGVARYVKPDSAVHLYSANGKAFYAVNANDAASTNNTRNQAFDWGHALVPESKLTDQVVSGWAPGSDGLAAPNGSPIWVTALAATTIYADFDQNGVADFSQAVQPLQSIRIYDNGDRDQSGMRVYTNDGTLITAAWGEDRSTANPARPNIDVGTVTLPYRTAGQPSLDKSVALLIDVNSNGKYDPGDTARYTIVAGNPSASPVTGAFLTDALPVGVTYVGGSAKLNGGSIAPSTFPAGPLNLPNPAAAPGTLPPGASYTIIFDVTINAGTSGQTLINTATLTTAQATLNDDARFNVPDAPTPPVCGTEITARFTDNGGTDVNFVLEGGSAYVTVADAARTHNNGVVESVQATVTNLDGGDMESITLTETNAASNVFRNTAGLPVSEDGGPAPQDGTLNGRPGQDLQVEYTNDLWGLSCNDTAVIAGPTQIKTLYLDDPLSVSLNPTKDAYLLSVRTDENQGASSSIVISTINNGVIQFDLSSLPAGATIVSAVLELTRESGTIDPSGDVIEVRGLTQSWVEGNQDTTAQACLDGVTWAERDCDANLAWTTAGGTYNGTIYATGSVVTGVNLWNVTTLAQAWYSGSLTNNGLLLRLASGSKVHGFSSRTGTNPPVLHISYSLPGESKQALDRIDPVATGDNLTSASVELGLSGGVATTGMAVYSNNTATNQYRLWNGASFGSETAGVNQGSLWRIVQGAAAPTRNEKIVLGVENGGEISGQLWNGSSWSTTNLTGLDSVSDTFWWSVGVAYEQVSGDAMIVWTDDNSGTGAKYKVWNGSSWTTAAQIPSCVSGTANQLRIAADPNSDEMVVVINHSNETDCAVVWNGSSWGNSVTLDNDTSQDRTDIYVAYESLSGDAMVVYNTNSDQNMNYRIWNGAIWSSEATITAPGGPTGYARWAVMDSDPNSDRIVLGVQTNDPDGWVSVWNGSAWGAATLLTESALVLDASSAPNLGVAFESSSGHALATYGRSGQNVFFHRTWTSGGGWSSEVVDANLGDNTNSMTLDADPNSDQIMLSIQDDGSDLNEFLWNGSSWLSPTQLVADTGENKNQPFVYLWSQHEGSTAVSSTTFEQTIPMASDFDILAGGQIAVTAYITTTGTMPANPAITARLKRNGTTFATLSNPAATLISGGGGGNPGALTWNTFQGGSGSDNNNAVAVDSSGNVYAVGKSNAAWGSPVRAYAGGDDASIIKLDSNGNLLWHTFLGGNTGLLNDYANGVVVDNSGNVYVTGQSVASWGSPLRAFAGDWDAYVAKLNAATGALLWHTFLGGTGYDNGRDIAVDSSGNVYVSGYSGATWGSPVRAFTVSGTNSDGFAAKLTSAGALTWHTFLGGTGTDSGNGVAVDSSGIVYVGGNSGASWGSPLRAFTVSGTNSDGFAARLTSAGALSWNTFAGGSGVDEINGLRLDSGGNVYLGGSSTATWGTPVRAYTAGTDGLVVKLTTAGALTWNTFLGGSNSDWVYAVAVGGSDNINAIGGSMATWGTPVRAYNANHDGFAAALDGSGGLKWNTFQGSSGTDISYGAAVDASGDNLLVVGYGTTTWGSPVRSYTSGTDGWVVKLDNATAEPSVYRLDWTNVVGGNVTVATGEQVVLEIETAEASTFRILYDSATYPSRIDLPTNTVIKVDDLAFYDAPYPFGSEITDATVGQTVFIRATVSDPFGYADIVTTTLDIDGTQIVLDPAYVISSAGATKVYEYPWLTPPPATSACNDVYPVSVTVEEGYENTVSASASAEIAVTCNDIGAPCDAKFLDGLGGNIVTSYTGGDTIFMQLVDYDRIASNAITVTLDGVTYSLNQTGPNTGIFQGADNTIAAGQTVTMAYSDPTAAPAGSDVCVLDISAPDASNPGISMRKTRIFPPGLAAVGGQVIFQLAVTNSGNQTLDPVQVVDTYDPAYLRFETADPAQNSTTASTITWNNVGPLISGQTTILDVYFTALDTISPTINSAVATGTHASGTVNDSDSDSVRIAGPQVDVTKTTIAPADRQASVGDEVTFHIDIHNTGDLAIDILPLTDLFDTVCLGYVSATPTPDAAAYGILFWDDLTQAFGQNLALDAHFGVDLTMRVLSVCNPAVNTAIVEGAVAENPPDSGQVGGAAVPIVEDDDFVVATVTYDFGDAPNSYGTTLAANGPRHPLTLFQPVFLGSVLPDEEADAVPGVAANSDDLNAAPDDEDAFVSLPQPVAGATSYSLTVPVSNTTGVTTTLYGWVDFDADGMFEASEGATAAVPYNASSATLNWSGVNITTTYGIVTYVRLRITSDVLTDVGATPVDERALGQASDGEVEDYAVEIDAPSMIGNQVWHDLDGDGLYEPGNGEMGISGVTVDLWNDVDGNGILNPITDTLAMTTTTDASGNYLFLNAPAGDYLVLVSDDDNVLAGYLNTTGPTPGANNNSQAQPYALTLAALGENLTADFGYALPATIGDFIFFDSNGNGIQDPGETSGIDGVPITVTNLATLEVFTTVSNSGDYGVANLMPGTYRVQVAGSVPGVTLTSANPINVTLTSGQTYLNADFGYIAPTVVAIVSFTAMAEGAGVRLYWLTSLEQDLDGFVVLRSTTMDGAYKAVSGLIPAMNDPSGGSYEWLDTSVDFESLYWYKLQAQPDGEVFGPIPSREDPGSGDNSKLYIPLIIR